jgi:hypothetical protein
MKRTSPATLRAQLNRLLKQNLAVFERLKALFSHVEFSVSPSPAQRAGLVSYPEICRLLCGTLGFLYTPIQRDSFPWPVWFGFSHVPPC